MRIALILPIGHHVKSITMPPIGLGYLGQSLKKSTNCEFEIIDCDLLGVSLDNFDSFLDKDYFDIYGISCWSHTYVNVIKMAKMIKHKRANSIIVLGGPHPSCSPIDSIGKNPEVDFIFSGEAEKGFPMLVNLLINNPKKYSNCEEYKKIPGLGFRYNDEIYINKPVFEYKLDELDFLDWHKLNLKLYIKNGYKLMFTRNFPSAPMVATRGCPYPCTYCAASKVSGKKIRNRSVGNIIQEINYLYNEFFVREIQFIDDNLTFNKNFIIYLCEEIKKLNKTNLIFSSPNGLRIETLDEEVMKSMKEAGWYIMHLGIETGNKTTQILMKKNIPSELICNKVDLIRKFNLLTLGFFIIGFPNERIRDILKTLFYAINLKLDFASFHPFTPFLGTEIYNDLVNKGEIIPYNFSSFSRGVGLSYSPPKINIKSLGFLTVFCFFVFHISSLRRLKLLISTIDQKVLIRKILKLFSNYLRWR